MFLKRSPIFFTILAMLLFVAACGGTQPEAAQQQAEKAAEEVKDTAEEAAADAQDAAEEVAEEAEAAVEEAADAVEDGGFAGTIRPDDGSNFSLAHIKIDVAENGGSTKM